MSSDSNLKPDKTAHKKGYDEGTMAGSKCRCPGQMYVPKRDHNESDFVGEKGSRSKRDKK